MRRFGLAAVVLVTLAAGVRAELKIVNVEARCAPLSPPRTRTDYCPGEHIAFSFDLVGLHANGTGVASVETTSSLTDAAGKLVKLERQPANCHSMFGLHSIRGLSHLELPNPLAAGEYTYRLVVKDTQSGAEASFQRAIRVKPLELAFAAALLYADAALHVPLLPTVQTGQPVWFQMQVIGAAWQDGKPQLTARVWVTDAQTKEQLYASGERPVTTAPAPNGVQPAMVSLSFPLGSTSRPGRFLIHLAVTDGITKKAIETEVPLTVVDP